MSPGTPTKTNDTKTTKTKVNDKDIANSPSVLPSLTSSINRKKSLFKGKAKFTNEQRNVFEWLKGLAIDTSEDTLSWWARNYGLSRLDEVYREAIKHKPDSIGAYMQKLLKAGSVVVSGRVELNAEFAKIFKDLRDWHNLKIFQKYAVIELNNNTIEVDFNMDPEEFKNYLLNKHEAYLKNSY